MKVLVRALVLGALAAALAAPVAAAQLDVRVTCTSQTSTSCNGWHRTNVDINWTVNPDTAAAPGTCIDETISNETTGITRSCEANEGADTIIRRVTIMLDKTAPVLTGAAPARPPDANGWYHAPVGVAFGGHDETSGVLACTATTYGGPDNGAAAVAGTCTDHAGNTSAPSSFGLRFDATPPAIAGITATRPPDHDTWYTEPVGFSVSAGDTLSGLAGCDPLAYDGPASAAAVVRPTCRDVAGNLGSRSFTFPFDASAPALGRIKVRPGDGVVRLDWAAADASKVRVVRSPGRGGDDRTELHDGTGSKLVDTHVRNGRRYEYRFAAIDQAGNESARTVGVVPGPRLVSPANRARVDKPPTLRWTPVRGADYYNVQLWRGKRKLLSTWPSKARLKLRREWRYFGGRSLEAGGEYRWLVWPGEGPRELNDYGRLIGRRTFIFAPNT
jgi:hypothetical protein